MQIVTYPANLFPEIIYNHLKANTNPIGMSMCLNSK